MCGIAGWISTSAPDEVLDFREADSKYAAIVERILDRQHHRGPDGRGIWCSPCGYTVFGHNRLSIVDLSPAAAQPMLDDDADWVITYNGELYNYQTLRSGLETNFNVTFKSNSDTEVFLNGIKYLGIDEFLRNAEGMFAAAIFSRSTRVTYLIRDRAGEKPLCYRHTHSGIYFASEVKPLKHALNENPQISLDALYLYFLLRYVPAPFSIYEGYSKVRPGHYIKLEPGKPPREYPFFSWDPHASEIPAHSENFKKTVQFTEKLLIKSLEQRLMSDVPLGFFLSGGIDSTLAAALIRKYFGQSIHTYTIGFEGDPDSEHEVSNQTAKLIGAIHKPRIFKQNELEDTSRRVILSMDEPNGDRSCVPTYLISEHAKAEVTVAIGGDGGDELFGGYGRYLGLNKSISEELYPSAYDGLMSYFTRSLPVFGRRVTDAILQGIPIKSETYLKSLSVHLFSPSRPEVDIRYVDFNSYLPDAVLSKVDRMSMQHSLEVRTPFLNKELLDIASRLPHEFLYHQNVTKPILRQICSNLGLSHVANLKKKGFGMPAIFLYGDQERLDLRLRAALDKIIITLKPRISTDVLEKYAIQNMNSIWATIVLGEWLDSAD